MEGLDYPHSNCSWGSEWTFPSSTSSIPSGSNPPLITHVTVLEDLPGDADDADLDTICRPLLVAKKGDTIEVVDRYTSTIWVGVINDHQGAFRLDNRVQIATQFQDRMRASQSCTAPQRLDGLVFSKGDIIEVSKPSDDNRWVWGKLNNSIGAVPVRFLEPVESQSPRAESPSYANDASSTSTPGKLRVRALFAYTAQMEEDLSFKTGDIIEVAQRHEDGWWDGILEERRGKFPVNFVTFGINPSANIVKDSTRPPWCPYYVRALYPYSATIAEELSFAAGEIIEVYDMTAAPWLGGRRRNGECGLFPVNYTIRVMDRRTPVSKVYVAPAWE